MTELFQKSIKTLELDTVLNKLASRAVTEEAKRIAVQMLPSNDLDDVTEALHETTDACKLFLKKGSPAFSGVKNISMHLDRANRGGCLNTGELLDIASVLRATRLVKSYNDSDSDTTCLDKYFQLLQPNKHLEDKILISILSEEEIADTASPKLADIRRHIRMESAKVRENLQKIISSQTYAKFLQENIITMRDGRFVVPVKAEYRNSIPGLVHDVSSSGNTYFIEPMHSVDANNKLKELSLEEQAEIERILFALSKEAADCAESICENVHILIQLDLIFAKASYSIQIHGVEPVVAKDGPTNLIKARHPLLDRNTTVPISVRIGSDFDTLVITGPNTGGKTVTLKTLGLFTLMAECGLHIPAEEGSRIRLFETVYADIGDEQSIEQSLSTFSAHMKTITKITEACDMYSLVLFDELGAGTDPTEGAALAIAIIEFCRKMGACVAATTHYSELKLYAMRKEKVSNASCEFDVETLRPTYRLLIGIPGKSNAFAISKKLGLSDEIINDSQSLVGQNDKDFEAVLLELEQQRQAMEKAKQEAEQLRLEILQNKQQSEKYYDEIRKEKEKATELAKREAHHIIEEARASANAVNEELKALRKKLRDYEDAQGFNDAQSDIRKKLNAAEEKLVEHIPTTDRPKATRNIAVGDTVEILKYGTKATVLSVLPNGMFELQAGIFQMKMSNDEIYLLSDTQKQTSKKKPKPLLSTQSANQPELELDIRGMSIPEAIPVVDMFIDRALMSNLPSVRIIHGKGTGVLRKGIQDHLKHRKDIHSFRLGLYGEGEDGVTIVSLSK